MFVYDAISGSVARPLRLMAAERGRRRYLSHSNNIPYPKGAKFSPFGSAYRPYAPPVVASNGNQSSNGLKVPGTLYAPGMTKRERRHALAAFRARNKAQSQPHEAVTSRGSIFFGQFEVPLYEVPGVGSDAQTGGKRGSVAPVKVAVRRRPNVVVAQDPVARPQRRTAKVWREVGNPTGPTFPDGVSAPNSRSSAGPGKRGVCYFTESQWVHKMLNSPKAHHAKEPSVPLRPKKVVKRSSRARAVRLPKDKRVAPEPVLVADRVATVPVVVSNVARQPKVVRTPNNVRPVIISSFMRRALSRAGNVARSDPCVRRSGWGSLSPSGVLRPMLGPLNSVSTTFVIRRSEAAQLRAERVADGQNMTSRLPVKRLYADVVRTGSVSSSEVKKKSVYRPPRPKRVWKEVGRFAVAPSLNDHIIVVRKGKNCRCKAIPTVPRKKTLKSKWVWKAVGRFDVAPSLNDYPIVVTAGKDCGCRNRPALPKKVAPAVKVLPSLKTVSTTSEVVDVAVDGHIVGHNKAPNLKKFEKLLKKAAPVLKDAFVETKPRRAAKTPNQIWVRTPFECKGHKVLGWCDARSAHMSSVEHMVRRQGAWNPAVFPIIEQMGWRVVCGRSASDDCLVKNMHTGQCFVSHNEVFNLRAWVYYKKTWAYGLSKFFPQQVYKGGYCYMKIFFVLAAAYNYILDYQYIVKRLGPFPTSDKLVQLITALMPFIGDRASILGGNYNGSVLHIENDADFITVDQLLNYKRVGGTTAVGLPQRRKSSTAKVHSPRTFGGNSKKVITCFGGMNKRQKAGAKRANRAKRNRIAKSCNDGRCWKAYIQRVEATNYIPKVPTFSVRPQIVADLLSVVREVATNPRFMKYMKVALSGKVNTETITLQDISGCVVSTINKVDDLRIATVSSTGRYWLWDPRIQHYPVRLSSEFKAVFANAAYQRSLIDKDLGPYPLFSDFAALVRQLPRVKGFHIQIVGPGLLHLKKSGTAPLLKMLDDPYYQNFRIGAGIDAACNMRMEDITAQIYDNIINTPLKDSVASKKMEEVMMNNFLAMKAVIDAMPSVTIGFEFLPEEQLALTRAFPELNIKFQKGAFSMHKMAAAVRQCYNRLYAHKYCDMGYIDVGGDMMHHMKSGYGNVHVCAPIKDVKDASRFVRRQVGWQSQTMKDAKKAVVGSNTITMCYDDLETCTHSARAAVAVEVYDVSVQQFAAAMIKRQIDIIHVTLVCPGDIFEPDFTECYVPDLLMTILKNDECLLYKFPTGTAYSHKAMTVRSFAENPFFQLSGEPSYMFSVELVGTRMSVSEYVITKSRFFPSVNCTMQVAIPKSTSGLVMLRLPKMKSKFRIDKHNFDIIYVDADFFSRGIVHAMNCCTMVNDKTFEWVVNWLRNNTARIVISGKVIHVNVHISPRYIGQVTALFLVIGSKKKNLGSKFARKVNFLTAEETSFWDLVADKMTDVSEIVGDALYAVSKMFFPFLNALEKMDVEKLYVEIPDTYTHTTKVRIVGPQVEINMTDEIQLIDDFKDRAVVRHLKQKIVEGEAAEAVPQFQREHAPYKIASNREGMEHGRYLPGAGKDFNFLETLEKFYKWAGDFLHPAHVWVARVCDFLELRLAKWDSRVKSYLVILRDILNYGIHEGDGADAVLLGCTDIFYIIFGALVAFLCGTNPLAATLVAVGKIICVVSTNNLLLDGCKESTTIYSVSGLVSALTSQISIYGMNALPSIYKLMDASGLFRNIIRHCLAWPIPHEWTINKCFFYVRIPLVENVFFALHAVAEGARWAEELADRLVDRFKLLTDVTIKHDLPDGAKEFGSKVNPIPAVSSGVKKVLSWFQTFKQDDCIEPSEFHSCLGDDPEYLNTFAKEGGGGNSDMGVADVIYTFFVAIHSCWLTPIVKEAIVRIVMKILQPVADDLIARFAIFWDKMRQYFIKGKKVCFMKLRGIWLAAAGHDDVLYSDLSIYADDIFPDIDVEAVVREEEFLDTPQFVGSIVNDDAGDDGIIEEETIHDLARNNASVKAWGFESGTAMAEAVQALEESFKKCDEVQLRPYRVACNRKGMEHGGALKCGNRSPWVGLWRKLERYLYLPTFDSDWIKRFIQRLFFSVRDAFVNFLRDLFLGVWDAVYVTAKRGLRYCINALVAEARKEKPLLVTPWQAPLFARPQGGYWFDVFEAIRRGDNDFYREDSATQRKIYNDQFFKNLMWRESMDAIVRLELMFDTPGRELQETLVDGDQIADYFFISYNMIWDSAFFPQLRYQRLDYDCDRCTAFAVQQYANAQLLMWLNNWFKMLTAKANFMTKEQLQHIADHILYLREVWLAFDEFCAAVEDESWLDFQRELNGPRFKLYRAAVYFFKDAPYKLWCRLQRGLRSSVSSMKPVVHRSAEASTNVDDAAGRFNITEMFLYVDDLKDRFNAQYTLFFDGLLEFCEWVRVSLINRIQLGQCRACDVGLIVSSIAYSLATLKRIVTEFFPMNDPECNKVAQMTGILEGMWLGLDVAMIKSYEFYCCRMMGSGDITDLFAHRYFMEMMRQYEHMFGVCINDFRNCMSIYIAKHEGLGSKLLDTILSVASPNVAWARLPNSFTKQPVLEEESIDAEKQSVDFRTSGLSVDVASMISVWANDMSRRVADLLRTLGLLNDDGPLFIDGVSVASSSRVGGGAISASSIRTVINCFSTIMGMLYDSTLILGFETESVSAVVVYFAMAIKSVIFGISLVDIATILWINRSAIIKAYREYRGKPKDDKGFFNSDFGQDDSNLKVVVLPKPTKVLNDVTLDDVIAINKKVCDQVTALKERELGDSHGDKTEVPAACKPHDKPLKKKEDEGDDEPEKVLKEIRFGNMPPYRLTRPTRGKSSHRVSRGGSTSRSSQRSAALKADKRPVDGTPDKEDGSSGWETDSSSVGDVQTALVERRPVESCVNEEAPVDYRKLSKQLKNEKVYFPNAFLSRTLNDMLLNNECVAQPPKVTTGVKSSLINRYIFTKKQELGTALRAVIHAYEQLRACHYGFNIMHQFCDKDIYLYDCSKCKFISDAVPKNATFDYCFDGTKIVKYEDGVRKSKFIVTSEALRTFYPEYLMRALESESRDYRYDYDQNFKSEVVLVETPPGGGKTTELVAMFTGLVMKGKTVRVITANRNSSLEIRKKATALLCAHLNDRKMDDEDNVSYAVNEMVSTADSMLMNRRNMKVTDFLLVDEVFMLHPGQFYLCGYFSRAKVIIGYGDSEQIGYIARGQFEHELKTDLKILHNRNIVYRNDSYRCPQDVCRGLSEIYGRVVRPAANLVAHSMTIQTISSVEGIPSIAKCKYIVYTQAEKVDLENHLTTVGCTDREPVQTVHEVQGNTYRTVALVRLKYQDDAVFASRKHITVALSRHTNNLTYYVIGGKETDATCDRIALSKKLQDIHEQMASDAPKSGYVELLASEETHHVPPAPPASSSWEAMQAFLEDVVPGSGSIPVGDLSAELATSEFNSFCNNLTIRQNTAIGKKGLSAGSQRVWRN